MKGVYKEYECYQESLSINNNIGNIFKKSGNLLFINVKKLSLEFSNLFHIDNLISDAIFTA